MGTITANQVVLVRTALGLALFRAALRRHNSSPTKRTIQWHTEQALERKNMKIEHKEERSDLQQDVADAEENETGVGISHAFGDGATWTKQGITGWGLHIQSNDNELREYKGRTQGTQNNDASESMPYCRPCAEHTQRQT